MKPKRIAETSSAEETVRTVSLPSLGIYRVQGGAWDDVWGPPREKLSLTRRWLRDVAAQHRVRVPMGHRFAHPLGRYEETYGATRLVGALLEVWANDVPDEGAVFAARLVRRAAWHPPHEIGRLPSHRIDNLVVLRLTVSSSKFVDLKSVSTRTWLSRHPDMQSAAKRAGARGVRFDSGLLEGSGPPSRIVTQNIGKVVYDDGSMFAGINFRTRVGGDDENWAVFQRQVVCIAGRRPLRRTDEAVAEALSLLGLELP